VKRQAVVIMAVLVIFASGIYILKQAANRASGPYFTAERLRASGLPVEKIKPGRENAMYREVTLSGPDLDMKISRYGNGLFMADIIKNLDAEKKNRTANSGSPIYVSGLFIIVVYHEPYPGAVKRALLEQFKELKEY
jgi:hypothetical protein